MRTTNLQDKPDYFLLLNLFDKFKFMLINRKNSLIIENFQLFRIANISSASFYVGGQVAFMRSSAILDLSDIGVKMDNMSMFSADTFATIS